MTIKNIDAAIANRATVRIRIMPGCGRPSLVGTVGIALGYNLRYHTVKFGFIDADGKYTGEKTVIGFNYVELVEEAIETHEVLTSEDGALSFRLSILPDDCTSPRLLSQRAKLKAQVEKAIKARNQGAPKWASTLVPKERAKPRMTPGKILAKYGDQVEYEDLDG